MHCTHTMFRGEVARTRSGGAAAEGLGSPGSGSATVLRSWTRSFGPGMQHYTLNSPNMQMTLRLQSSGGPHHASLSYEQAHVSRQACCPTHAILHITCGASCYDTHPERYDVGEWLPALPMLPWSCTGVISSAARHVR